MPLKNLQFLRSVQANVASVMCSYSKSSFGLCVPFSPFSRPEYCFPRYYMENYFLCKSVNSSYACGNDKMLNKILKGELGFPGCTLFF